MRSIVRRAFAPLGAAVCLTALSSVASAEPTVHVAPSATALRASSLAARAAVARHAPLVVDHESRARVALSRVSPFAAARRESLVATTADRFGDGETVVRFEQTHRGLPVIGRGAAVRLTSRGDELLTRDRSRGGPPEHRTVAQRRGRRDDRRASAHRARSRPPTPTSSCGRSPAVARASRTRSSRRSRRASRPRRASSSTRRRARSSRRATWSGSRRRTCIARTRRSRPCSRASTSRSRRSSRQRATSRTSSSPRRTASTTRRCATSTSPASRPRCTSATSSRSRPPT